MEKAAKFTFLGAEQSFFASSSLSPVRGKKDDDKKYF
jgi:hypothetical protein